MSIDNEAGKRGLVLGLLYANRDHSWTTLKPETFSPPLSKREIMVIGRDFHDAGITRDFPQDLGNGSVIMRITVHGQAVWIRLETSPLEIWLPDNAPTSFLIALAKMQAGQKQFDAELLKAIQSRYKASSTLPEEIAAIHELNRSVLMPILGYNQLPPRPIQLPGTKPSSHPQTSAHRVIVGGRVPGTSGPVRIDKESNSMSLPDLHSPPFNSPPLIFVASSIEARPLAKALIRDLADPRLIFLPWWESVRAGRMFLSELDQVANRAAGALFVFTPDITGTVRRKRVKLPNQNVLFELGYFFTAVKPERIAIIKYGDTSIPSDLLGFTHIKGSKFFKAGAGPATGKATKRDFSKWVDALQLHFSVSHTSHASLPKETMLGVMKSGLNSAKNKAQAINCKNNLKQVALAARLWSGDHGDILPPDLASMKSELGTEKITSCPTDSSSKYEILSPGADLSNPSVVYALCRAHGHAVLADGSVQELGERKLVQNGGRWLVE